MGMNNQNVRTGYATVTADATAQSVEVGFEPSYIKCQNITDIDIYEHHNPGPGGSGAMVDGYAVKTAAVDGVVTVVTANGITPTANGFTMGTAICTNATEVVYWIAIR